MIFSFVKKIYGLISSEKGASVFPVCPMRV